MKKMWGLWHIEDTVVGKQVGNQPCNVLKYKGINEGPSQGLVPVADPRGLQGRFHGNPLLKFIYSKSSQIETLLVVKMLELQ